FSSEEHPQMLSHTLKLRSRKVIPVILGDSLPKRDGTLDNDAQYYHYMLLLFRPWRHFDDILSHGESWSDAFERAHFSPYCQQLMANMVVDSECRDAK
ncbi:hypothetical protein EV363DRAFT_1102559, partial [Boletus edulis]